MIGKLSNPINYQLPIGDRLVDVNSLIGKELTFSYENQIFCVDCGRQTYKSFNQGFCYSCFQNSPLASECIIHPERCQAHLGIGRDMEWETKYHLTPQIVYLALTANSKVGITRMEQIPSRWIDQGAFQTIILAKTPNRYLAGKIEVHLKSFISDKTHWQKMLKNDINKDIDLRILKQEMIQNLSHDLKQYVIDSSVLELNYPVEQYPVKIKSLGFDKMSQIKGTLTGIKGQYLMLDNQFVLNIRKHTGYLVSLEF